MITSDNNIVVTWFTLVCEHAVKISTTRSYVITASGRIGTSHLHFYPSGLLQGILTGIRGLSNGFGPAVFGLLFYIFHVQLDETAMEDSAEPDNTPYTTVSSSALFPNKILFIKSIKTDDIGRFDHTWVSYFSVFPWLTRSPSQMSMPGGPFLFGALLAFAALLITLSLPELKEKVKRVIKLTIWYFLTRFVFQNCVQRGSCCFVIIETDVHHYFRRSIIRRQMKLSWLLGVIVIQSRASLTKTSALCSHLRVYHSHIRGHIHRWCF